MVEQASCPNAAYFSCNRAPALIVGRSPWAAADALVGLLKLIRVREAGRGRPARTRGSAQGSAPPIAAYLDSVRKCANSQEERVTCKEI